MAKITTHIRRGEKPGTSELYVSAELENGKSVLFGGALLTGEEAAEVLERLVPEHQKILISESDVVIRDKQ